MINPNDKFKKKRFKAGDIVYDKKRDLVGKIDAVGLVSYLIVFGYDNSFIAEDCDLTLFEGER